jgi:hypothetical protein
MTRPGELFCRVVLLYQLLDGESCPDYAYRYRFLGSLDPRDPDVIRKQGHTWTDELLEHCRIHKKEKKNRYAACKLEDWFRATADKLVALAGNHIRV